MFKHGMKVILGVSRVTIKRTKNIGTTHNLLLDWNTLMVPHVVATEDFIHLNVKYTWFLDGHISYEDSEVIMKPETDWGKPSLGWTDSFVLLNWWGGGWDTTYEEGKKNWVEIYEIIGCSDFSSASAVKPNILHSSKKDEDVFFVEVSDMKLRMGICCSLRILMGVKTKKAKGRMTRWLYTSCLRMIISKGEAEMG
nr:hypothetical protein [Tanacetum cinerariifolium]